MIDEQTSAFSSERTKRIREHLAKSSGGEIDFQRSPQNYSAQTRSAGLSSTQRTRMEHLERSKGNYNLNSGNKQKQKSRIMNHVNITRG